MSVRIREARPTDAAAIARVHVDSWRTTYIGLMPDHFLAELSHREREHFWREVLTRHSSTNFIYIAEDGEGNIMGFASGGPEREGNETYRGELYAIYLLEQHQRKGIGRRLVSAMAKRLLKEGYPSMLLWVLDGSPACEFYEALGGERTGEKPIEIGGAQLTELAYGWKDISGLAQM